MRFSDFITSVNRLIRAETLNDGSFKLTGDDNAMIIKKMEELFIIMKSGSTARGIFENIDEDSIYIDGNEIPISSIIFSGKM